MDRTCTFAALPPDQRAPSVDDFAADSDDPPNPATEIAWVAGIDLRSGGPFFLPLDLVSLDYTRAVPSPFTRTSAGIASGATGDEALIAALHELIERDAVAAWRSAGFMERMTAELDPASVGLGWFVRWRERLDAAGIDCVIRSIPTVTRSPMFVCTLLDDAKPGRIYRGVHGFGCHSEPEVALFRALSEAIQARATCIAGARDDLRPDLYLDEPARAIGSLLPPGEQGLDFASIVAGPRGVDALTGALAAAGHDRVAAVELAKPPGLTVMRAFACGLGAGRRRRRTHR